MKSIDKFRLLIALILMCSIQNLHAQDLTFGAKAGLNFSNVKGPSDPDGKIGIHLGGFASMMVSEEIIVQPELLLSFQGTENSGLTYINAPVVAKYYVTDEISVHGGLQIGLLIGGENNATDYLKTIDFGIPIGGEYQITDQIGAGIRYVLGLSDLNESGVESKNRILQIFGTYILN